MLTRTLAICKCIKISHRTKPFEYNPHPLLSYGFTDEIYSDIRDIIRQQDKLKLLYFSKKYQWNIAIEKLLNEPYQALILTNNKQVICWIN